jgi:hypothetical protein
MLSAKIVAQNPLGSDKPALLPGQALLAAPDVDRLQLRLPKNLPAWLCQSLSRLVAS